MFKGLTLRTFPPEMGWKECLDNAAETGFESVELNFDGRLDIDLPSSELSQISSYAGKLGIRIDSVYSRKQWSYPVSSSDSEIRKEGIRVLDRLIEIAGTVEARAILVIPGAVDNSIIARENLEITSYEDVYRRSLEVISEKAVAAGRAGVVLAVENVPGKFLMSPLEMKKFIEDTGSDAVGCYFDVANCLYCQGYPDQWIRILGNMVKAVHLKDYRVASGTLSGFVNMFEGDIDWPAVAQALADTGYDLSLTSEVLPHYRYHPEHLWKSVSARIDSFISDIENCKNG